MLENEVKELLSRHGIRVPYGMTAGSGEKAVEVASEIPGPWMVKTLIPMGKKGKAGLVRRANSTEEVKKETELLLGLELNGFTIRKVLVEEQVDIEQELYVSFAYDSITRAPVMLFSSDPEMEIEISLKKILTVFFIPQ